MFCRCCASITLDVLLNVARAHEAEEHYHHRFLPTKAYYCHYATFSDLLVSAERGCEFCSAIQAETRVSLLARTRHPRVPNSQLYSDLLVHVGFPRRDDEENSDFDELVGGDLSHLEPDAEGYSMLFLLTRHKDASCGLSNLRLGLLDLGPNLGSEECFSIAKEWLDSCLNDHSRAGKCRSMEDMPLPTRLIDIGMLGTVELPKLFHSSGQKGCYVTLSYCWGAALTLKTTKASLDNHLRDIPLGLLPSTLRDAMRIRRRLGFRYLWVDAICIIQDSQEDWEKESSVMDLVYANATLTIAAAAGKDDDSGLLNIPSYVTEDFEEYCHFKLHLQSPPYDIVRVSSHRDYESFYSCFVGLPLCTRGWALQERLLSQRILSYGEDQIFFQCRSAHLSADGIPPEESYTVESAIAALLDFPSQLFNNSSSNVSDSKTIYDKWMAIVLDYCEIRQLTFPNDKLPALGGIASAIQRETCDEYLAGIWSADFNRGLLWNLHDRDKEQRERAPSWSWARWDNGIEFGFTTLNKCLTATRRSSSATIYNFVD